MSEVLDILLVEDNEADVLLAELAWQELSVPHRLHVARDGVEALDLLQTMRPHLILLDLNMPRMSGLEVLLEVKDHPVWRTIPVIVLTTSRAELDVWESYHRHANAYIVKPNSTGDFVEKLRSLQLFWQIVALLPPTAAPRSS